MHPPPPTPPPPLFYGSRLFFCYHFEELQTVLTEVKLIINNARLTYAYPNTIKTCLNTQSFVVWQAVFILTQHQLKLGI